MIADDGMPRLATSKNRPGWRLTPWALCLVLGAYSLVGGIWSLGFMLVHVARVYPSGPIAMSGTTRIAVLRFLLFYATIVVSGMAWCVCGIRCRRGDWRSAGVAAVLAVAFWASLFGLWPGHDAWP